MATENEINKVDDPESQELLQKNRFYNFGRSQIESENIENAHEGGKHNVNNDDKTPNGARTVLWYLSFFGFVINYMQRINLNIAIVGMVKKSGTSKSHGGLLNQSECFDDNSISLNLFQSNASLVSNETNFNGPMLDDIRPTFSVERIILDMMQIKYERDGFSWNEYEQGLILGSFFWIHWLMQVPGGALARVYGTKLIFGYGNMLGSIICSLMPIASYFDYKYLIVLKVVQGFICGGLWPSMHHMVAKWIPPNERSTFISSYMGSSIGVSIFFPLFGYIIQVSTWEWVFHLCSLCGLAWFILWQYYVYDSPAEHPRIDPRERSYIEESLVESTDPSSKAPTPWCDILKSLTIWVNVIGLFGSAWCFYTLMTQAPTYFAIIHGWNLKMSGFLSGAPHFIRAVFAYGFSVWCDWLLKENKMTRNQVRILSVFTCNGLVGIFTIFLAYSGCSSLVAILSFTIALTLSGTVTSGPFASFVDISPNFASILFGIGVMLAIMPGFISPIVVGKLTLNNQTIQQWQYVFLISAAFGIGTSIFYAFFSDTSIQYWNDVSKYNNGTELKEINLNSSREKGKRKNISDGNDKN